MPVEVIGLHFFANSSEAHPLKGVFDVPFIADYARAHEEAGFDRILIGQTANWPDGIATASYIASVTTRLKFMVAHRPGFVQPTMAARMFATLDQISGGRAGVHVITGASDLETQADGDFLSKEQRYQRSHEYVEILRAMWSNAAPFDHAGAWYRFRDGFAAVKPVQAAIPVFWGGGSDLGIRLGAACADIYAIGPSTLERTGALVRRIRGEAAVHGRVPGISMSMRVILGETEVLAWEKAASLLAQVLDYQASGGLLGRDKGANDPGARRALETAGADGRADERLWTGIGIATQGRLHATALVGTARQVADALLAYYDIGVDRFLLNGFDTIPDVIEFGRELIPRLREGVALRDVASASRP